MNKQVFIKHSVQQIKNALEDEPKDDKVEWLVDLIEELETLQQEYEDEDDDEIFEDTENDDDEQVFDNADDDDTFEPEDESGNVV